MQIMQSAKTVLQNYAKFEGRSGRPEYWWWVVAYLVAALVVGIVGQAAAAVSLLSNILALALFIPSIAVGVRRFHDIGKSGWWLLIGIIPIVGWIAVIYFAAQPSQGSNQFGEGPQPLVA